jgi:uncharacterized SAM-binding protein YcdF (DUF218 family)
MLLILSKLLTTLLNPVGAALLLLACGLLFTFVWRKARAAAVFFACAFAVLLVFSLPITEHLLLRGLEGRYRPQSEYGQASAVVLLGGFTRGRIPPRLFAETTIDANRAFGAVRVWRQGAAPKMMLTGGLLDWTTEESISEADNMLEILSGFFGIDSADVLLDGRAQNTRDNARYTREALEAAGLGLDIILVTSAYHTPRAVAVFEKAGFKVTPAPAGYIANSVFSRKPLLWLPGASSLFSSSIALHEYIGLAAYRAAGWI